MGDHPDGPNGERRPGLEKERQKSLAETGKLGCEVAAGRVLDMRDMQQERGGS